MMNIVLSAIASVRNSRITPVDDNWSDIISEIHLSDHVPTSAFDHIADFSHLEIIFYFDQVSDDKIVFSGRPRGNPNYQEVGIFGQRKKDRPNKIGLCTVELIAHKDRILVVRNLDAINGTPILDIKPVFKEFQPQGPVVQPEWVADLMKNYWK